MIREKIFSKRVILGSILGLVFIGYISAYNASLFDPVRYFKKLFFTTDGSFDSSKATVVIDGQKGEINAKSVKVNGQSVATKSYVDNKISNSMTHFIVNTWNLGMGVVRSANIAFGAVQGYHIANNSINSSKIADGSITLNDLSPTLRNKINSIGHSTSNDRNACHWRRVINNARVNNGQWIYIGNYGGRKNPGRTPIVTCTFSCGGGRVYKYSKYRQYILAGQCEVYSMMTLDSNRYSRILLAGRRVRNGDLFVQVKVKTINGFGYCNPYYLDVRVCE